MAISAGTRLGIYEVGALIGRGGMGEVYRARDTTLNRDVALKVLPASFASDADRLARFTREAQTLASLNHPHIAAIYGLERGPAANDFPFLVMELVEGDDLSEKIAEHKGKGGLPLDEALPIAKQIAEALEAAHEQGIVHRDLKPGNIKVRSDGTVKVLDFGLAKAMDQGSGHRDQGSGTASMSPTITTPAPFDFRSGGPEQGRGAMTQAGMILGTAAYMSPEQAKGRPVDKRSDLWAFGAVLYEMLTGERVFKGEDISDTLAAILRAEPDWTALPATTPASIRKVLRRCLEKDRKRRLADAADARLEIEDAIAAPDTQPAAPSVASSSRTGSRLQTIALAIAAVAIVGLAIPVVQHLREAAPAVPPETRLDLVTPATETPNSFALSPDGRQIIYTAMTTDGVSRLWLRTLSSTAAQPLAGTDGATFVFWSADSQSVGFFSGDTLKRLDLGGGAPRVLFGPALGGSGTWSKEGVIVFAPSVTSALMRMSATGGAATALTTLKGIQTGHVAPRFLPDGQHFLFQVRGGAEVTGLYLGSLDGSDPTRLAAGENFSAEYLRSGWMLWVRSGTLVAQRLDLERKTLVGEPVTVADNVSIDSASRGAFTVSATGLVAFRTGTGGRRQLTWVDRSGTPQGTLGDPDSATLRNPHVSPDGHRVVVQRSVQGNTDVWMLDGARMSRVTFDPGLDYFPLWSPDGTRIVFRSVRTGPGDLYQTLPGGGGTEEMFLATDQMKTPSQWSADGRYLIYASNDPKTSGDLWVLPMTGEPAADRKPFLFLKTPFREVWAVFSPDSRWVAYQSNDSGPTQVYIRPFVAPAGTGTPNTPPQGLSSSAQWQVSTSGGMSPVWRRDGKELYYVNPTGDMMAVPITAAGSTIDAGTPVKLFAARMWLGGVDGQQGPQYDVAPDGRFLINRVIEEAVQPITVLQNWKPPSQ